MNESKGIIFKGGTSLSKCYGLTKIFSEDIDLTTDKTIFAAGGIIDGLSGNTFEKLIERNGTKAINSVPNVFRKKIEGSILQALEPDQKWSLSQNNTDNFHVRQSVLIEIGARGDI